MAIRNDVQDVAWAPKIPAGHTEFSWFGEDDQAEAKKQPESAPKRKQQHQGKRAPRPFKPLSEEEKTKLREARKAKKESQKAAKKAGGGQKKGGDSSTSVAPEEGFPYLDLRVGIIVKVWEHPDADKLWCEEIDLGEASGPRQICSGLRAFYKKEEFLGKQVVVVANLKESKLRGVASNGMVLCATNEKKGDEEATELLAPPAGSKPGDRVLIEGMSEAEYMGAGLSINAKKKNSVWFKIAAARLFKTLGSKTAVFNGKPLVTAKGKIMAPTLAGVLVR